MYVVCTLFIIYAWVNNILNYFYALQVSMALTQTDEVILYLLTDTIYFSSIEYVYNGTLICFICFLLPTTGPHCKPDLSDCASCINIL